MGPGKRLLQGFRWGGVGKLLPSVHMQARLCINGCTKEPRRDWKTALETDGRHKVRMASIKTWTRRSRATATRPRARDGPGPDVLGEAPRLAESRKNAAEPSQGVTSDGPRSE